MKTSFKKVSQFTIYQTKTHLSKILERVRKGEEIIIAKGKEPVARILPFAIPKRKRTPGSAAGLIQIKENFDDPLPDSFMHSFK